jgi:outer membrane biosynthesis protein TonB
MLRRSIIASGFLHLGVIAATSVAWPRSIDLPDEQPPAIPIELVQVADVTNVAPAMPDPPKPQPEPQQETPPQADPPPPPEAEAAPEPDKPPVPKPAPKEETASAPANPVRPRLKPQRDLQPKFDIDSVLALLDKDAPKKAPVANAKPADVPVKGIGAQDAFTVDLKDALLSQMRECWNIPVGAPNPEQLIVQIRVFLAPDGSLAQPPQLEPATRSAATSNPYMRSAAEAALRAINVCEPYKHLPPEKYDAWREVVMTFDPGKMLTR